MPATDPIQPKPEPTKCAKCRGAGELGTPYLGVNIPCPDCSRPAAPIQPEPCKHLNTENGVCNDCDDCILGCCDNAGFIQPESASTDETLELATEIHELNDKLISELDEMATAAAEYMAIPNVRHRDHLLGCIRRAKTGATPSPEAEVSKILKRLKWWRYNLAYKAPEQLEACIQSMFKELLG